MTDHLYQTFLPLHPRHTGLLQRVQHPHQRNMLQALYTVLPEFAVLCSLAYSEPSNLKYAEFSLLSQVGSQQGEEEHLGPMLFCLPTQNILAEMASPLTLGYIVDVTLGGKTQVVVDDIGKGNAKLEEWKK